MNSTAQSEYKNHSVSLKSREKLVVDGVVDILEFDNNTVNLKTSMGDLSVEGDNLKIISMSKNDSQIYIEGRIDSLFYYDTVNDKKSGFFKRNNR